MTYKKLLIMFIIGVLFVGVGSGVCVMEFGSYRYMGSKTTESDPQYQVTDFNTIDVRGKDKEIFLILDSTISRSPVAALNDGTLTFVEDETLSDNTLRVEVTYDSRYWRSSVDNSYASSNDMTREYDSDTGIYYYYDDETDTYYDESQIEEITHFYNEVYIGVYRVNRYAFNDFELVLEDLKNREIYNYYDAASDVKVTVYGTADTLSLIKY